MHDTTLTRIGNWRERLLGRSFAVPVARDLPRLTLGSSYGAHCVCPSGLDARSVVYSFGVGEDISFDLALIEKLNVTVHAFDPTPRALELVRRCGAPASFVMHPFGLAARDGKASFFPPANPAHVSHSLVARATSNTAALEVEMRRLPTVMRELGHSHIDVLKMDIEGEEYAVIEDMLTERLDVRQLLIEFHHQFENVSLAQTKAAVEALAAAGYRVFDVSPNGRELSFTR